MGRFTNWRRGSMTKSTAQRSKTIAGGKSSESEKEGDRTRGTEGAFRNLAAQLDRVFGEAVKQTGGGMSKKSHFRYRDSMKGFLWFCADRFRLKKIANIGEKHLRAYVGHRRAEGTAEKTIKEDLSAIRFFHRFSGSENELPDNQALGIGKTPFGGKERAWTDREYDAMIAEAERLGRQDVVLAVKIARLAGLRIHECTRLTNGHLRDGVEKGEFEIVGKGGRIRSIPVGKPLKVLFVEILEERGGNREDRVLAPESGKTHEAIKSIQKFISRHRKKFTDRDITFHGLRHVYAGEEFARELGEGSHSKKRVREAKLRVAELLGHGRPGVTDIYINH
jgi:integrase